eukprot:gene5748-5988_t
MVPMDQPAAALDMITRFMRGKSWAADGIVWPLGFPVL